MRVDFKSIVSLAWIVACSLGRANAQDLAPRAYVVAPIHSNAVTITSSYSSGEILLNGVESVPDSNGTSIHRSSLTIIPSICWAGTRTLLRLCLMQKATLVEPRWQMRRQDTALVWWLQRFVSR